MSQRINTIPRLELLFSSIRGGIGSLRSQHDLLVAALHAVLLGQDLLLLRLGDNVTAALEASNRPTELLLDGWNESQDAFTFIYQKHSQEASGPGDLYLFKALRIGGGLHVSMLRWRDQKVANLSLEVGDYVTEDWSTSEKAYRNTAELARVVTEELLQPFSKVESRTEKKGDLKPRSQSPEPPLASPFASSRNDERSPGAVDPFAVGRGDLDPLGGAGFGGGGGMIMDPMRQWRSQRGGMGIVPPGSEFVPGGLPRGAVPPGARFDPFGPPLPPDFDGSRPRPGGGGVRGPDPDHFAPPGYDDMFM